MGRRLAPPRTHGRGRGGGGGGGSGSATRPQPRDGEPRGRDQGAIPRRRARQRDVRAAGAAGEADAPGVGLRQARVRGAARADAGAPPRPARDVLDLRRVQGEQARDHVPPHHRPLPQAGRREPRDLPPGADGRRPPARRHHLVLQPGALWVTPHIRSHTASPVSHPASAPPRPALHPDEAVPHGRRRPAAARPAVPSGDEPAPRLRVGGRRPRHHDLEPADGLAQQHDVAMARCLLVRQHAASPSVPSTASTRR